MQKLYTKILEVQKRMKAILREETNPHFKSKFFDINGLIASLKPVLNEVKLVVIQPLTMVEGKRGIDTILFDPESCETQSFYIELPEATDAPKFGATCTYFRRYALTSLFLLEGEEDNDGETSKKATPFMAAWKAVEECDGTDEAKGLLHDKITSSPILKSGEKAMLLALLGK